MSATYGIEADFDDVHSIVNRLRLTKTVQERKGNNNHCKNVKIELIIFGRF